MVPLNFLVTNGISLGFGVIRALLVSQVTQVLPYTFDTGAPPGEMYDFIVVGAGVGGSVVASRLSETGANVLLLEAGKDAPPESAVPGIGVLMNLRDEDWKYRSKDTGQTKLGYVNKNVSIRTGKVVGGTSVINSLLYIRGNNEDMNNWARMGNTGWDYNSVLPYFLKSEDYTGPPLTRETAPFHRTGGPIGLEFKKTTSYLWTAFIKAGKELGYKEMDPNLPNFLGIAKPYHASKNGIRSSASESFLRPVAKRPNLTVIPRATVRRVIFNRQKEAVGVDYVFKNKLRVVHCRKEVILSAGALNTPKILMLSGVGPKQHLKEMKIRVVAPVEGVGLNLQNHPVLELPFKIKSGVVSGLSYNLDDFVQYFDSQKGKLASWAGGESIAFVNVNDANNPTWPDAWFNIGSSVFSGQKSELIEMRLGMDRKIIDDVYGHLQPSESMSAQIALARPKSRGSVTLNSNIFTDPPLVQDEPCTHSEDMETSLKLIRKVFEFVNTQTLKSVANAEYTSKIRYCSQIEYKSDEYWRCFIRYTMFSGWHYAGTAKMSPSSDPLGVVSPRLRVRGVSRLRVIDGSIMPQIVGPNPMATIYMIGEKGADMIKQDWGYL